MKEITIWERFNYPSTDGKIEASYSHNHIQDGWNADDKPTNINKDVDRDWKNGQWRKTFAYIKDGVVFEIEK